MNLTIIKLVKLNESTEVEEACVFISTQGSDTAHMIRPRGIVLNMSVPVARDKIAAYLSTGWKVQKSIDF